MLEPTPLQYRPNTVIVQCTPIPSYTGRAAIIIPPAVKYRTIVIHAWAIAECLPYRWWCTHNHHLGCNQNLAKQEAYTKATPNWCSRIVGPTKLEKKNRKIGSRGAVNMAGQSPTSGLIEDPQTFSVSLRDNLYKPSAQMAKAVEPAATAAKQFQLSLLIVGRFVWKHGQNQIIKWKEGYREERDIRKNGND